MSLRRKIRYSDHWAARAVKSLYYLPERASMPLPILRPLATSFLLFRDFYWFLKRVFFAEPFFKAFCSEYGRHLRTGVFLHWICGRGKIVVGDHVTVDGCCSFKFAARYTPNPRLVIGSHTGISHGCRFIVGKEITIGEHCRLAGDIFLFDAPGHPADPAGRMRGEPAPEDAVKPIHIGNNVWIGRNSTILPGVTIGDHAIVSTGSVVFSDVPAYAIVAGNPARVTGAVPSETSTALEGGENPAARQTAPAASRPAEAQTINSLTDSVARIVCEVGNMPSLAPEDDIYQSGLSSMGSVVLMLRLEEKFQIAIPDERFTAQRTVSGLAQLVASLLPEGACRAA